MTDMISQRQKLILLFNYEADFIATKKTNFWLQRASAAMAKTKAMLLLTDLPNLSVSNKRNTEKEVKTVPLILIAELK